MKVKILFALAACVGITAVTGCGPSAKQRDAITHVLTDRLAARKASQEVRYVGSGKFRHEVTNINSVKFEMAIKQIDFQNCPKNFQDCWLAYVQTWERVAQPDPVAAKENQLRQQATASKLEANVGYGGSGLELSHDNKNLAVAADHLESQDTSEAFRKVETVAVACGVDCLKFEDN